MAVFAGELDVAGVREWLRLVLRGRRPIGTSGNFLWVKVQGTGVVLAVCNCLVRISMSWRRLGLKSVDFVCLEFEVAGC